MDAIYKVVLMAGNLRQLVCKPAGAVRWMRSSLLISLIILFNPALAETKIVASPVVSLVQNARILDRFSAQIQLEFGFEAIGLSEPVPPGFESRNSMGLGDVAFLEFGAIRSSGRGYELYVKTFPVMDEPAAAQVFAAFEAVVESSKSIVNSPDAFGLAYEIYTLSYIQSDRAIALLKALGYTTVEYAQGQGDTIFDKFYNPRQNGDWQLPVVIKLIDAPKTSLMDKEPNAVNARVNNQQFGQQQRGQAQYSAVPDIGGTYLHNSTAGEPQQRLLIAYDKDDHAPVSNLISLLRNQIDKPARQIAIEALVIEVNTEKISEMGLEMTAIEGDFDASFAQSFDGTLQPFSLTFTESDFSASEYLQVRLNSLIASGEAEVLSSPSVLVLDGRQARIQVGQQVPVVKSTSTNAGIISAVDYFPVGIVLNLRPRINSEGTEVTMQVETIVSSLSQTGANENEVFVAPTIDNRQVQTFVRVADNTPFIIGGLISSDSREVQSRIPLLSKLPFIGGAFKKRGQDRLKKEVIIVLTPHVISSEDQNFSYLLPQDSEAFNSFGNLLFRNAYRITADDIFDLKFIYSSDVFKQRQNRLQAQLLTSAALGQQEALRAQHDSIPGEHILVNRMIWEIVNKTGFSQYVKTEKLLLFNEALDSPDGSGFVAEPLNKYFSESSGQAVALEIDLKGQGTVEHPLVQPIATLESISIRDSDEFTRMLVARNESRKLKRQMATILLTNQVLPRGIRGATALELLKGIVVLKKVLELNSEMPRTLKAFREGRQLLFPSTDDLGESFHLIDFETAELFYEVLQYYPEFEAEFKAGLQ